MVTEISHRNGDIKDGYTRGLWQGTVIVNYRVITSVDNLQHLFLSVQRIRKTGSFIGLTFQKVEKEKFPYFLFFLTRDLISHTASRLINF